MVQRKKKEGYNVQYNNPVSSQNSQLHSTEYGVHNARDMVAPSYGNSSFSQNHNAGEIHTQVGGIDHRSGEFPSYPVIASQRFGDYNRAIAG